MPGIVADAAAGTRGENREMHASSPSNHGAGDARTQRLNMVESQIRPSDMTDRRIIRAMSEIPREAFVPSQHRAVAYMDDAVPLVLSAQGRVQRAMLPPRTAAKMIQQAAVEPDQAVLVVGAGTGYSAAVLARLAKKVVAVEVDATLADRAKATLAAEKIDNVVVKTGALSAGSASDGPFDAILIDGAVTEVPQTLLDQLKQGGRLVAIVSDGGPGRVMVWIRSHGSYTPREVFDATATILPGFEKKPAFTF